MKVCTFQSRFRNNYLIHDLFYNLSRSEIRDGRDTNINQELIRTSKRKKLNQIVQRTVKVISSQGKIFTLQQSISSFRYLLTQQIFQLMYLKRFLIVYLIVQKGIRFCTGSDSLKIWEN